MSLSLVAPPNAFVKLNFDTICFGFQEEKYKDLGKKCLYEAWDILQQADWKLEKQNAVGDTVHSMQLPKVGKVFKLTVSHFFTVLIIQFYFYCCYSNTHILNT